jgi:hypothetical protein
MMKPKPRKTFKKSFMEFRAGRIIRFGNAAGKSMPAQIGFSWKRGAQTNGIRKNEMDLAGRRVSEI